MNDNEYFDDAHPLHDSDGSYQHERSHCHAQRKKRQRRDSSQQQTKNDASYSYYTRSACSDTAASTSKSTNKRMHPSGGNGGNVLDLTVIGKKCVLHRNDDLAEQLDQGKHLIDLLEDHQPSHRQHGDNDDPYSSDMDDFYSQQESGVDNGGIHASNSPPGECNSTWTDIIHPFVNSASTSNSTNGGSRAIPNQHHLFVDRYDARTLLDDVSIHEGSVYYKHEANDLGVDHDLTHDEKQLIDIERFGDLKLKDEDTADENYRECTKTGGDEDEGTTIPGGSHKLGHKLESPTRTSTHINSGRSDDVDATKEDGFELDEKERAMVPLGISIPKTQRQYNIISMTAKKSREAPQFEVLLKLKQADNPEFSFVRMDSDLYPFYRWKRDGKNKNESSTQSVVKKYEANNGNSMGLLDMYGSSSDDDDDDSDAGSTGSKGSSAAKEQIASTTSKSLLPNEDENSVNKTIACSARDDVLTKKNERTIEEQRAERLNRAKLLRHHFAKR